MVSGGADLVDGSSLELYLQRSDGTFDGRALMESFGPADFMSAGDLNGDGRIDLVVYSVGYGVFPLFNRGASTFDVGESPIGWPIVGLAVADLDGDGLADIAANVIGFEEVPRTCMVLLGRGDGGFGGGAQANLPFGQLFVLPDRPGAPDLAALDPESTGIQLLVNRGNGQFAPGDSYATPPGVSTFFASSDFDSDGVIDMAVSGSSRLDDCQSPADGGGGVVLLLGTLDGGYQSAIAVPTSASSPAGIAPLGPVGAPHALAIADSCGGGLTVSGDASRH